MLRNSSINESELEANKTEEPRNTTESLFSYEIVLFEQPLVFAIFATMFCIRKGCKIKTRKMLKRIFMQMTEKEASPIDPLF